MLESQTAPVFVEMSPGQFVNMALVRDVTIGGTSVQVHYWDGKSRIFSSGQSVTVVREFMASFSGYRYPEES